MFIYLVNLKQIAFNGNGDIKSDDGKILQVFYCFAKNGINLSSLRMPAHWWLTCVGSLVSVSRQLGCCSGYNPRLRRPTLGNRHTPSLLNLSDGVWLLSGHKCGNKVIRHSNKIKEEDFSYISLPSKGRFESSKRMFNKIVSGLWLRREL